MKKYLAHVSKSDGRQEQVMEHLLEVSKLTQQFASKLDLSLSGALIGLVHDLGKYSNAFQQYIRAATGLLGCEEKKTAESRKGKVDHATAGAQLIWEKLKTKQNCDKQLFAAQLLATCVASHHTGLLDFVSLNGKSRFLERMSKAEEKAYRHEVIGNIDPNLEQRISSLISSTKIVDELMTAGKLACQIGCNEQIRQFNYGLLTRYLFSCLIDADRLSAANFEKPNKITLRNKRPDWDALVKMFEGSFENKIAKQSITSPIFSLRQTISQECVKGSSRQKGLFTLSVPTGGGKTLSSLRFALHHARHHAGIERIIYVVPYTSIIEQNAQVARDYLAKEYVLEHHSNLVEEKDTWRNRVLSENWDAPIVFTSSVQFLDALFSSSTSSARRMHQLANSIIIFDEIQTLPIKTVHLFNNAINFLVKLCGASVVLCTATQPLLHQVDSEKGSLQLNADSELISNPCALFNALSRTQVINRCRIEGWTTEQTAELALTQAKSFGSTLVIVNTKKSAYDLYESLSDIEDVHLYHLSTNMCPAHRKRILERVRFQLNNPDHIPIICISTQLIEAGVDIDFGSVIRYLAGLDSIAQAAGRCNRHGRQEHNLAPVLIVNPAHENLDCLLDIRKGQEITKRILDEWHSNPSSFHDDLLSPAAMQRFYEYYFYARQEEMDYPVSPEDDPKIEAKTTLLSLLSRNSVSVESYQREQLNSCPLALRQGFATAGKTFRVIDAPTRAVLISYGNEGKQVIDNLVSAFNQPDCPIQQQFKLLRRAQYYSVNLFPNHFEKLNKNGAIYEVQKDAGIYYLDGRYYSNEFGVSLEEKGLMEFLNV